MALLSQQKWYTEKKNKWSNGLWNIFLIVFISLKLANVAQVQDISYYKGRGKWTTFCFSLHDLKINYLLVKDLQF